MSTHSFTNIGCSVWCSRPILLSALCRRLCLMEPVPHSENLLKAPFSPKYSTVNILPKLHWFHRKYSDFSVSGEDTSNRNVPVNTRKILIALEDNVVCPFLQFWFKHKLFSQTQTEAQPRVGSPYILRGFPARVPGCGQHTAPKRVQGLRLPPTRFYPHRGAWPQTR